MSIELIKPGRHHLQIGDTRAFGNNAPDEIHFVSFRAEELQDMGVDPAQ
jgi:hypothetical protein